jgi:DNA-binding transcriptional LysR family regulator
MQDLNDLRFFAAVVTNRSFSKAALTLGLPKSRLSRRVAMLEEELGVRLLERSTRRLQVTEIGQEVYAQALTASAAAEAAAEAALRVRAEPQGFVRLSCPLNLHDALTLRLPAFLHAYPRLRLQILSTNRRVDLIEERVDVAIRIRERLDTDADLQMRRIGLSHRIIVMSPALSGAFGVPVVPEDLLNLPLLDASQRNGPALWRLTHNERGEQSLEFEPRFAAGDLATLTQAAVDGIGAALLPETQCLEALQSGRLIRLLPDWSAADGVLHLVFTSRRSMLPGVRAVIDFVAGARGAVDTYNPQGTRIAR